MKKIKLLLLGYSAIAQKSLLPAIKNHKQVTLVGIASQTRASKINFNTKIFNNYQQAIDESGCDTTYISTQNSSHYELIRRCLKKGLNVIVDKPAVLSKIEAKKCYQAANNRSLIFEAIPYLYHPQHKKLRTILESRISPLRKVGVQFGFPPLQKDNYRNKKELGGGCIFDLGPYVVSAGQFYFNKKPKKVYCVAHKDKRNDIPKLASVTMWFGENEILQGYIGFELEYRNTIDFWGSDYYLFLDRSFTTPRDHANSIFYKSHDVIKHIPVQPSDSFRNMFDHYVTITPGFYVKYNQNFLERAAIMDAIIRSSVSGNTEVVNYK